MKKSELALKQCRIVAPEKLSDRFINSGALFQKESLELHDQVFLAYVFEITKSWFPSSKVLPTLIETLENQLPHIDPKKDLGDQFEHILKEVNENLNTISEGGETDWIGNLNGIILVISNNELHFSQTGRCPTYLLQKNRIRQITDDTTHDNEPHPLKTFFNIASGSLQENDYILLSNQELYNEISLDALRRVMNNSTPANACTAIVRELKKERNLAVSSIILQAVPIAAVNNSTEITEVILEEEMQSPYKKFQKRLTPILQKLQRSLLAISKAFYIQLTHITRKTITKVGPALTDVVQKSTAKASDILQKNAPYSTLPIIEIIPPKKQIQATRSLPSIDRDKFTNTITTIFSTPKNRRISAIIAAALVISLTTFLAINRSVPQNESGKLSQIDEQLGKAEDLQKKATNAIQLKQNVEASRQILEAQSLINSGANLNDSQKKRANVVWDNLLLNIDQLAPTTRLSEPAATFEFNSPLKHFVSNLPYFYGFNTASSTLLRSGKGDPGSTQGSVQLPDASNTILSIVKGSDSSTAAYVLTRNSKVFRVTQDGVGTNLRAVSPSSGEFAPGDAISTYLGNIYILDGKTGLLWKYVTTGTTYNKGISAIDSTKYDLKKSLSLAIDGSIFILKTDGTVLKFTSNIAQDFSLTGQPEILKDLVQPLQIITNEDMNSIYVLDGGVSSGSRSTAKVLEYSKNGVFVKQYTFPTSYNQILSFDIDQNAKKMWVLNNNKISEFDL